MSYNKNRQAFPLPLPPKTVCGHFPPGTILPIFLISLIPTSR